MTAGTRNLKILLAEDDDIMRELTAHMLSTLGHGVTAVGNGAQALDAYRAEPADVVILDINMPVKNGLETLRQLLRLDPDATVIMLTGVDETSVAESCVTAGAVDYVQKGLGPEALGGVLAKAIEKSTG